MSNSPYYNDHNKVISMGNTNPNYKNKTNNNPITGMKTNEIIAEKKIVEEILFPSEGHLKNYGNEIYFINVKLSELIKEKNAVKL